MSKITHPLFITIQQEATGKHLHQLFLQNGYSVRDVQIACGLGTPQAVYKWLSGQSLPSIDCLLVLSRILHVGIEEILVLDGDFFCSRASVRSTFMLIKRKNSDAKIWVLCTFEK